MKRFLLSMAALLTIAGCAQQEELVSADLGATNAPEFGVGIETSRVAVAEDGENYVMSWAAGDRVSVFFNDGGNSEYKFIGETGATSGIIRAVNAAQGEALANFYAIYPYAEGNSLEGDVLSFTLPAEQQYIPNTFAPGANTMVATTTDEIKSNFSFSNVCGYLRLKIYGDATIKSIKVEGNNGEIIAGAATYNMTEETLAITGEGKAITLNCGEGVALGATEAEATSFWFVVPATAFEKGLTITMTDAAGTSMTQMLGTAFTIERNTVHSGVANYVANNIDVLFDARFNADGTATNIGSMTLNIDNTKRGSTVTTYKKGDQYVALLDNATKNNDEQTSGFYYVDYTSNSIFKEHLKDGFTMEILCKPNMYYQNYWATPFSLSTCRVHHNQIENNNKLTWSLVASAAENDWLNTGIFKNWFFGYFSPVIVNAYQHVVLTYDGVNSWDMIVNGKNNGPWENPTALNPGNALAIGGIAYTEGRACHLFCGEIAIARIYDSAKSVDEVVARYNELKPLIETLNTETTSEYKLDILVDVEFAESGATDKANGYAITTETVGTGGNLSVANGIATFGADNANLSYYNIDLAQGDGTLKTEMNNGFTIEAILSSTTTNPQWGCPFGGEGFSLVRLAGYGYKWNINGWNTDNGWPYTDGVIAPVAGQYYHILYTYDATTGRVRVYRNGLCENKKLLSFAMRENSNLLIGARNENGTIHQPWDGNIASLKIYKQAVPYTVEAAALYNAAKAQVESLNGN